MTDYPLVLVVDDEADSAANVQFVLEKNDFRVAVVHTAEQTFRFLEGEQPDLILLDVVLPDIPGIEFCKALKLDQRSKTVPVVLISGQRVTAEDRLHGIENGAFDYLTRPFKANELVSALHKALSAGRDREDESAANRELASYQTLSIRPAQETAALYNAAPLKKAYPESFQYLQAEYNQLLDESIEVRFFLVEHNLSERLGNLAERLGFLKAGAKDILDLHRGCILNRIDKATLKEQKVILEESRLMLIELMGYMINHYRKKSKL